MTVTIEYNNNNNMSLNNNTNNSNILMGIVNPKLKYTHDWIKNLPLKFIM